MEKIDIVNMVEAYLGAGGDPNFALVSRNDADRMALSIPKVIDACIWLVSTHLEKDGGYCDTGADMDWDCRSACNSMATERLLVLKSRLENGDSLEDILDRASKLIEPDDNEED